MIAHVAEAGEARGRVVLQVSSSRPSPIALAAAVRIAQAFRSEIESVFIEDQNLIELASFPFAREVMLSGKARPLTVEAMERELRFAFASLQRQIEAMAALVAVPVRRRIVRDDPLSALVQACAECGPWNLIALTEPITSQSCAVLQRMFDSIADATGFLVVGPQAKRTSGRIVVLSDETDRLLNMIRVAERLAAVDEAEIAIALVSDNDTELAELEANVRLLLAGGQSATVLTAQVVRDAASASEVLRRHQPGFVIARHGGLLVPSDGNLRALALALECPLLLVR